MIQILLVEDDENISFGIKAALKRKEYACTSCTTIEEAKRVFTDSFQLVLLDLNLPDGTGYEFCSWVKERSQMPIIFLTVRDDVKDITRGLDMGADDYITNHSTLRSWNPESQRSYAGLGRNRIQKRKKDSFPVGISSLIRRRCRPIWTAVRWI